MKYMMIVLLLTVCVAISACKKDKEVIVQPGVIPSKYDFTWTTEPRATDTIIFKANAPGDSRITWDFGDGSKQYSAVGGVIIKHVFNKGGTYKVSLVVDSLEIDKVLKDVVINEHTQYSIKGVLCTGDQVSFVSDNPDAKEYLWDFGDGTTSTDAAPTHVYNNKGVYKVSLKVDGEYYAKGQDTLRIYRKPEYTNQITKSWNWDITRKQYMPYYRYTETKTWVATFPVSYVNSLTVSVKMVDSNTIAIDTAVNYIFDDEASNEFASFYRSKSGGQLHYDAKKKQLWLHMATTVHSASTGSYTISYDGRTK